MLAGPPEETAFAGDSVAPNSLWMASSVAVGIAQGVAVTYVMSHHLGLVAFGQLGLIISCTSVVFFASGSTVANVLRETARARFESSMVVMAMLTQVLLAVPILLVAIGILHVVSGTPALLGPAAVLGGALILRTALGPLVGFHLGRGRMQWQMLDTAQVVLTFVALLVFVALGTRLYALPLASLVGALAIAIPAAAVLGPRMPPGSLRLRRSVVKMLVVPTLLWSGANLAQQIHWSTEPLLAPVVMDHDQVGLFIAAGRFLPGIRSLAAALGVVFLPVFVHAVKGGDARQLYERAMHALRYLLPIGVAVTAGLFICAEWIVALLYPAEFRHAAPLVRLLSFNATAMFLHWQALCLLFAADQLVALLTGYGVALAVRLALGMALGLAYGATGLAIAEVSSDWILALVLSFVASRTLSLGTR